MKYCSCHITYIFSGSNQIYLFSLGFITLTNVILSLGPYIGNRFYWSGICCLELPVIIFTWEFHGNYTEFQTWTKSECNLQFMTISLIKLCTILKLYLHGISGVLLTDEVHSKYQIRCVQILSSKVILAIALSAIRDWIS